MTESQSRYSIMEEFNQKKLNTRSRLAQLLKEMKTKETEHRYAVQNTQKAIKNETDNYETNHQLWKGNMLYELSNHIAEENLRIKLEQKNLEEHEKRVKKEITDQDKTYERDHGLALEKMNQKLDNLEENNKNYIELKKMDIHSIETEIQEIDNAIKNLKEMSSEQAK